MDQRKLMDNANTITDMAKTQNTVYEIVSDMSSRQDILEEKITHLEDKIKAVQVKLLSFSSIEFFIISHTHSIRNKLNHCLIS
jgi:cob(I)alamin adenosyltransferase